jgi:DNA-binding NarL/FixJ family response regulator
MSPPMSSRDLRLLALLARGHTTDRAARELRLSRHTVGEEISALLGRCGCRNRAELVAYSYVHRLLPVGVWPPAVPSRLEEVGECS